jgi:hypothetical protein
MPNRCSSSTTVLRALLALVVCLLLHGMFGRAQTPARSTSSSTTPSASALPRTPWGDPDLEGTWNFANLTPLERPGELAGKQTLTDSEAGEFEKKTLQERTATLSTGDREWWDPGTKVMKLKRTSLVTDPADGRVPALTDDARKRAAARASARKGRGPADSWEDRSLSERCIWFGSAGPPMIPGPYNNNVQFFQTRELVVMLNEMIHDVRVVPLDGRPRDPDAPHTWMGDSRGHWEGRTLVVDTINFSDERNFRGSSDHLHLVERFTRVDADTLDYQFTAEDPTTWPRPWTASFPMTRVEGSVLEYACHEGNYRGMSGTLSGARAEEAARETGRSSK